MSYLYLVCNGSMEVLQNGSMVVAILGKGDLVGFDIPFSLVSEALIKSSSDVKALTYCDLKSIHVPGLLEVLRMYPEFAETFCTEIVHDLTFNLREGYQNDHDQEGTSMLHGSHSLTLPSISEEEDEDEDDDDADNDDNDDSGSGSPPSSPSVGPVTSGRRATLDWTVRRKSILSGEGTPLIPRPRPTLRFAQNKIKNTAASSCKSAPVSEKKELLREEVELTRSSVDRLDSQMTQIREDVSRLTDDLRNALIMLQQLCSQQQQPAVRCQQPDKAVSCQEIPPCGGENVTKTHTGLHVSDSLSQKCSSQSLTNSSSCSQLVTPCKASAIRQTRASQTERSLLDDFINKIPDSGSPPPNSGYSSSSSNEERVKFLIGMQSQRNAEDSESASDDSVLRPSTSLTMQSISSRDASPFKGPRNSWSTVQSLADTSSFPALPHPSPRPNTGQQLRTRIEQQQQCAIDMEVPARGSQSDGKSDSPSLRKLC
jgi:potassium voltage-gated channel Eag-related subfamily H protein 8